jgi:hypothetical protein
MLIDQCPESPACDGRLRIVSLTRDERIRRRCGQAMIAKCSKCGTETAVVKDAWIRFMRDRRRQAKREREDRQAQQQPSLF